MTLHVLDPTNETAPPPGIQAPRPASLAGKTVGLISNGKEGTAGFFTHLDRMLRDDLGAANVVFRRKPNYSAPCGAQIAAEITGWDTVITGIGD